MKSKPKTWALSSELHLIAGAVEAARMLSDAAAVGQFGTEHDNQFACDAASAVLTLAGLRLRDLDRVLRGDMPVDALRSHHNESDANGVADRDVVFSEASRRK